MIPNLFTKLPIPSKLPSQMEEVVKRLKRLKSKKRVLEEAFNAVTFRFHGEKMAVITRFFNLFRKRANRLWKQPGVMHCTQQNYLLRIFLIKSGKFKEADIKQKLVMYKKISPHQYLQIRVGNQWISADPWAVQGEGLPLGHYAR